MAEQRSEFVQELLSKINLVDVVGEYCTLQRKGANNHWACCPLPGHTEKTPSFTVNEIGQFYHCFGCGKGGDAITFIQQVEKLDFVEALRFLADKVGMAIPSIDGYDSEKARERRKKLIRYENLMKDTAIFYVNSFANNRAKPYIEYVKTRGLTAKTLKNFGIGVSLDFSSLPKHLKEKGYTEKEMVESGVVSVGKDGGVYDFEAERLVVPIINAMGKVIAFGGRTLDPNADFGKYKNTQETILFDKKNVLFNANNLKKLQSEEDYNHVIMVEGYMDVISLYQAGIKNVVASMGTSLTKEQAKLLRRYTDKVIVSYDGDGAGQKATVRSLDIFEAEGFDVRVATLPDGLDPDDVIKKYGVEGYRKILDDALPLIDYKLKLILKGKNLNDVNDKRKYVSQCITFLRTVKDAFMREELLKKVRDVSGISYESLKRDLESGETSVISEDPVTKVKVVIDQGSGTVRAERFVLSALIYKKPYTSNFDFAIYYSSPIREKIADALLNDDVTPKDLFAIIGEDGAEELNSVLIAGETIFGKPTEAKYFNDCVTVIKKSNIQAEIKQLNAMYKKEPNLIKKQEIAELIELKNANLRKIK